MKTTAMQRAQALLEGGPMAAELAGLWPFDAARRRALAWEVKDECLAAWTADPPGTRRAAAVLSALHEQMPDFEVAALADWAAGIAALAEGGLAAALPMLERAQAALAAAGRHHAAAETMVPKIMALAMLGRHAEALACGEEARTLFARYGDGHAAGRVELNLGTLLFRMDRHADAARMYRSAAVRFARARDDARSILADIGLAHALTWLFDFDEALRVNHRALRRASQRALRVPQAQARLAIGRIELLRGRFHLALPELVQALAVMDEAGAAPQQRLEAATALADAYLAVNLLPEARDLYDRVIADARALDAPTEEARARVERARVCARLGERAAALADLERALALFDLAGNSVAGADALIAAGRVRLDDGDAPGAAVRAAAATAQLRGSGVIGWQLDAENLAAEAAARQGDVCSAAAGFAAVLERAHALGLVPQQVAARVGQGAIALGAGRAAEARLTLAQALDLVDAARAELVDDEFRVALAALGERAHALFVRATAREHAGGVASGAALFDAIERGRARALALGLGAALGAAAGDDPAGRGEVPVAPDGRGGVHRWAVLRQRWRELVAAGHEGDVEAHAGELRRLEKEWLESHRQERMAAQAGARAQPGAAEPAARVADASAGPGGHSSAGARADTGAGTGAGVGVGPRPDASASAPAAGLAAGPSNDPLAEPAARPSEEGVRARAVQRALRAGEAMVSLHLDGLQLTACIVRPQAVLCIHWPVPGLDEAIANLRFQIETPRHSMALLRAHGGLLAARVRARAAALHDLLWAPLAPALQGAQRVVVVPHGALHAVPWCALHDGRAWLVERCEIELAASATAWLAGTSRPWQTPARVLALGAASEQLPHVRLELEAIGHVLPHGTTLRLGEAARAESLRLGAAGVDVVHLACHGQFRADSPAFSSLTLADGPLTLHDLRGLRLSAALVVLSACETGSSRLAAGDEMIGLVRGFTLAGAERVLATQWAVSDASMAGLMADFYRSLAAGLEPAAALAAAQRAAVVAGDHPFQWAALALYGRR